jgi:hypothetical protein
MSDLINRWFGRAGRLPGAFAYGLRYANAATYSHTWEPRLSEAVLKELWNRLTPMIALDTLEEAPEFLRWTFNGGLVVGASRSDGTVLFILASKKPEDLDQASLQRLLSEFRALRG